MWTWRYVHILFFRTYGGMMYVYRLEINKSVHVERVQSVNNTYIREMRNVCMYLLIYVRSYSCRHTCY